MNKTQQKNGERGGKAETEEWAFILLHILVLSKRGLGSDLGTFCLKGIVRLVIA